MTLNIAKWQDFAALAPAVYADDAHWLGEDLSALHAKLSGQEAGQLWWDCIPGEARVVVSLPAGQNVDGEVTAFFGYWEGSNTPETQAKLFARAEAWAAEQGATRMLGPINLSTFNAYRVRLNHFDKGAFPGEPYNPDYYPALLTQLGYSEAKRFHSWIGPLTDRFAALAPKMEALQGGLEAQGLVFSALTPDVWLERLDDFYAYVDQIFGNNYAYTGISRQAFKHALGEQFAARFCPHASVLVTHQHDASIAGFFLGFPDYAPLIRAEQGNIRPLSSLRYADIANYQGRTALLGKSGGVHPDYRQNGLFGLMSYLMMKASEPRYDWGGAVLVRADNPSARTGKLFFGRDDDQERDYALFSKALVK